MESRFKAWETTKDSISSVYNNFIPWIKLFLAPFIFIALCISLGLIPFLAIGKEANLGMMILAFIPIFLGGFIGFLMFATNAYRYLMLNEGGKNWLEFRFDRHMWRLFLYSFLMGIIIFPVVAIGGLLNFFFISQHLQWVGIISLILTGLAIIYLVVRMIFCCQLAASGFETPLKTSFTTSKGHVWRLVGLILLVFLFSFALFLCEGLIEYFIFLPLIKSTSTVLSAIAIIADVALKGFCNLFVYGVMFTAYAKAYFAITGTSAGQLEQQNIV